MLSTSAGILTSTEVPLTSATLTLTDTPAFTFSSSLLLPTSAFSTDSKPFSTLLSAVCNFATSTAATLVPFTSTALTSATVPASFKAAIIASAALPSSFGKFAINLLRASEVELFAGTEADEPVPLYDDPPDDGVPGVTGVPLPESFLLITTAVNGSRVMDLDVSLNPEAFFTPVAPASSLSTSTLPEVKSSPIVKVLSLLSPFKNT
ncbi:hypothetical protein D3C78_1149300 [compost metagenome]